MEDHPDRGGSAASELNGETYWEESAKDKISTGYLYPRSYYYMETTIIKQSKEVNCLLALSCSKETGCYLGYSLQGPVVLHSHGDAPIFDQMMRVDKIAKIGKEAPYMGVVEDDG